MSGRTVIVDATLWAAANERLHAIARPPLVECSDPLEPYRVQGFFGSPLLDSSFKSILGLGLLLLAHERGLLDDNQPVIESTSGSFGVGLAQAGQLLGHPVHLVSDINVPIPSLVKMEALGARVDLVENPHPVLGFQQAREDHLRALLESNPTWYWTRQNESDLNPEVYRRWMMKHVESVVPWDTIAAGVFCVGSGGHFTAFAELLRLRGIPVYVADREGSITFGGVPGPSRLRGVGNQNSVPGVIRRAMHHATGLRYVSEQEATETMRELLGRGLAVGGSSVVSVCAAKKVADSLALPHDGRDTILTYLPDRADLYPELLAAAR